DVLPQLFHCRQAHENPQHNQHLYELDGAGYRQAENRGDDVRAADAHHRQHRDTGDADAEDSQSVQQRAHWLNILFGNHNASCGKAISIPRMTRLNTTNGEMPRITSSIVTWPCAALTVAKRFMPT